MANSSSLRAHSLSNQEWRTEITPFAMKREQRNILGICGQRCRTSNRTICAHIFRHKRYSFIRVDSAISALVPENGRDVLPLLLPQVSCRQVEPPRTWAFRATDGKCATEPGCGVDVAIHAEQRPCGRTVGQPDPVSAGPYSLRDITVSVIQVARAGYADPVLLLLARSARSSFSGSTAMARRPRLPGQPSDGRVVGDKGPSPGLAGLGLC
jgi:hypothetical protein